MGFVFDLGYSSDLQLMQDSLNGPSNSRVSEMMKRGAQMGMTVSPGVFNERVFKGLDYVIVEARRHRIQLILSLVNNLKVFGGKAQYVRLYAIRMYVYICHYAYRNFQEMEESLLAPIMRTLAPLANISIESQVLYHTPKSSFAYWDKEKESYIFSTKDLPFFAQQGPSNYNTFSEEFCREDLLCQPLNMES
ncbi:hypothetical protein POM88_034553 [Heracleum sosnowskyi]|uniref:Glycoside hydrolase family 5 domain-containing protein n=1 Tax=Heracleum sosnowskyi TaxID=360622 RepID=A0AAD8MCD8_9APIA|nr:hypothetical protein POM88_034553 [Heracleum sosnowskyi]